MTTTSTAADHNQTTASTTDSNTNSGLAQPRVAPTSKPTSSSPTASVVEHQPTILQLAAASLSTDIDLVDIKRSQRLREEIDLLKSSIPTVTTPTMNHHIHHQSRPPVGVIANQQQQQQQQQQHIYQKRRQTTTTTATIVNKPTQGSSTVTTTSRPARPPRDFAPLASLDFSITTDSSIAPIESANNNENILKSTNLSSGSSSTIDTPTLSGYFDCDELSDMVDDSLFEITNAGCLSRSVFGVERSTRSHNDKELPNRSNELGGSNQNKNQDDELSDDDRSTPTNKPTLTKACLTDVRTSSGSKVQAEPAASIELTDEGAQPTKASSSLPVVASRTGDHQQQKQLIRSAIVRGHDYSSTTSVPNHIKSSLASNQLKTVTTISSASRQSTGGNIGRSSNLRRHHPKARSIVPNKRVVADEETSLTSSSSSSSNGGGGGDNNEPPRRHQLVPNGAPSSASHVQLKVTTKLNQPTRKRSQSNSMVNKAHCTNGYQNEDDHDQDINRRCPICRETMAGENGARLANKKTSGKRRFTFSLFNLFTSGQSQQNNNNDCDEHNQIATCHHHQSSIKQLAGSRSTTTTSTKRRRSAKNATSSIGAHQAYRNDRASSHNGQQPATIPAGPYECPPPPMRLRDSIKITNQRKQRQTNRLKAMETGKGVGRSPRDHQQTGNEVLLDLSSGQPTRSLSGGNSGGTARPRGSGQHQDASATTIAKSKSVKFTTPDRVMFLSPEPPIEDELISTAMTNTRTLVHSRQANCSKQPLVSSQSSSQLASSLLDLQPAAPIIKRHNVPKSSSYSQTEPNKGLDELLAKYEQNNKLVAEINEKLHLTETISSNKTVLDAGNLSSQECDDETIYDNESDACCTGKPVPFVPMNYGAPRGKLCIDVGEPDQASRMVEYETEDLDEAMLGAIQKRLDELDAQAAEEHMTAAELFEIQQPPEDFSECDCNHKPERGQLSSDNQSGLPIEQEKTTNKIISLRQPGVIAAEGSSCGESKPISDMNGLRLTTTSMTGRRPNRAGGAMFADTDKIKQLDTCLPTTSKTDQQKNQEEGPLTHDGQTADGYLTTWTGDQQTSALV